MYSLIGSLIGAVIGMAWVYVELALAQRKPLI
jgi:VanZ family protein